MKTNWIKYYVRNPVGTEHRCSPLWHCNFIQTCLFVVTKRTFVCLKCSTYDELVEYFIINTRTHVYVGKIWSITLWSSWIASLVLTKINKTVFEIREAKFRMCHLSVADNVSAIIMYLRRWLMFCPDTRNDYNIYAI